MLILESDMCMNFSVLATILFIKNLIQIISYIVPVILVLLITVDITKAVMASDDNAIKQAQSLAIKRIISALIVFFVPIIVDASFKLIDDKGLLDLDCYTNAEDEIVEGLSIAEQEKVLEQEKNKEELIKAYKKSKKAGEKKLAELIKNSNSQNNNSKNTNSTNNLYKNGTKGPEAIAKTAESLAWSKNTSRSIYHHNYGNKRFKKWSELGKARPTENFKTAMDQVYKGHWKWGVRDQIGASCDVFVGTVVRYSGYDKAFPRGLSEQSPYLSRSSKWERVSSAKRGDVCINGGHVKIYLGNGKVAEAGYNTKRFGIVKSGGCSSRYRVYRAKN